MAADFTIAGVHVGCSWSTRSRTPAMTGLDIDVPAIAWNSCPGS